MAADLPDVTPAEIEAAIDLLCSRGWSPPNAHGFATDIRDAIIAARRRAPPLAAPAPSAMATGEVHWNGGLIPYSATPPAAPAAVTGDRLTRVVFDVCERIFTDCTEWASYPQKDDPSRQDVDEFRVRMHGHARRYIAEAIQAALAAAASAERGE